MQTVLHRRRGWMQTGVAEFLYGFLSKLFEVELGRAICKDRVVLTENTRG